MNEILDHDVCHNNILIRYFRAIYIYFCSTAKGSSSIGFHALLGGKPLFWTMSYSSAWM